jgi:hypothetical protein
MDTVLKPLRVLFAFGLQSAWFDADAATRTRAHDKMFEAYDQLKERFGVTVLGTMDDDLTLTGPSHAWPWTCYILADVPDLETVTKLCQQLTNVTSDGSRLSRYLSVEARIGRELFFGNR